MTSTDAPLQLFLLPSRGRRFAAKAAAPLDLLIELPSAPGERTVAVEDGGRGAALPAGAS